MKKILNNKLYRILLFILVFIGMFYVPNIFYDVFLKIGINNEMISKSLANILYVILLILLYLPELKNEFKIYKKNFKSCLNNGFKYWSLGLLIMVVSNIIINIIIFGGSIATNEEMNREVILNSPLLYTLISAVICGPIIEELTFRKGPDKIFKNEKIYLVFCALLFGFIHIVVDLSNYLNLLYIIPYGGLGYMLAKMNIKTNTIFTSIMMHSFHNLLATLLIMAVL